MKENGNEKVDSYLNYVVEEWMKENELAVERYKNRNQLRFFTGLKDTFSQRTLY